MCAPVIRGVAGAEEVLERYITNERERAMSEQELAAVQTIYEAFGRGDVATIVDLCADDVDWAAESSLLEAPWHGGHKGKDEVPRFFEALGESIEVTDFTPLSFATNDQGDVLAVINFAYTVPATGKSSSMEIHHFWHFENGKVARYRGTEDTAQTAWAFTKD